MHAFINAVPIKAIITKANNNIKISLNTILYCNDVLTVSYLSKAIIEENDICNNISLIINQNITKNINVTITPSKFVNIVINKKVSDNKVEKETAFNYTYEITNYGNTIAENVVLSDQLPQDFLINRIDLLSKEETKELEKSTYSLNNNNLSVFNQTHQLNINAQESVIINVYGMIKKP